MQYQPETEKVSIMVSPSAPTFLPVPLSEDYAVQRTRRILMIILQSLLVSFYSTEI